MTNDYEDLTLSFDLLEGTTVLDGNTDDSANMELALELLQEIDVDNILDGNYSLEGYESAWVASINRQQFPVISVHRDEQSRSVRRKNN